MFTERELELQEVYSIRAWLIDFSNRVEPLTEEGRKIVYRFGRQFKQLRPFALELETAMADLRVKHGIFKDGKFVVLHESKELLSAWEKDVDAISKKKVKAPFLSNKLTEANLTDDLSGIKVSDGDFLEYFT